MAIGNPCLCSDIFGEEYVFWTDGLEVWFSSHFAGDEKRVDEGKQPLGRSATMAFEQVVEDSPIGVLLGSGCVLVLGEKVIKHGILVTYLDEDGNRISKINALDGKAGCWEAVVS